MSTIITDTIEETTNTLLTNTQDTLLIIAPPAPVIEAIVNISIDLDTPPTQRLLADEDTLNEVTDDFLIASNAADLIANQTLSFRTADVPSATELFITPSQVSVIVSAGTAVAALTTDDPDFVPTATEHYTAVWNDAAEHSLRTPPLSRVRDSLRNTMGPDAVRDFDDVLASLETARGNGNGIDEVTICLLVAAKNEELLYDISKWGEDVGLASKATFSRTKTMLEDLGLIDTEKVPIDVGRPRLRLKFAHERLQTATASELASVAQSLMT